MLRFFAACLFLVGCSSTPPLSDGSTPTDGPADVMGGAPSDAEDRTSLPAPEASEGSLRIEQCSRETQAYPLQPDPGVWIRDMVPVLGCPMAALDDPLWGFSGHVWVPLPGTDGRAVTSRDNDEAPGLNVFILPEEDTVAVLYRVLRLESPDDTAPVFQSLLASVRVALGAEPSEVTDQFALFPRSADRPFRARLSIEGADVALVVDR